MKMVSQLTRQAMSRHRILTGNAAQAVYPPQPPTHILSSDSLSGTQSVRPLYSQPALSAPPAAPPQPGQPSPAPAPRIPAAEPPHHSIYSQLMLKHDRMSERHLKGI